MCCVCTQRAGVYLYEARVSRAPRLYAVRSRAGTRGLFIARYFAIDIQRCASHRRDRLHFAGERSLDPAAGKVDIHNVARGAAMGALART